MLEVMRDILQSRYVRGNVEHKQLARTSLRLTLASSHSPDGLAPKSEIYCRLYDSTKLRISKL